MAEMTPAEVRRVLTKLAKEFADARNHRKRLGYGINEPYHGDVSAEAVNALTYALSQAWVPKEVAEVVVPLVVAEIALEQEFDDQGSVDSHTETWQALADALEGVK
jgi:hypothetical protein